MVDAIYWRNTQRKGAGKLARVPGKTPTLVLRKAADVAALSLGADLALTEVDLGDDLDLGGVALLVPANQDIQDFVNALKAAVQTQVNAMQAELEAHVAALHDALEADSAARRASARAAGHMR